MRGHSPFAFCRKTPYIAFIMSETRGIEFLKMEGAGNDFPVFDLRARDLRLNSAIAAAAGDRRFGIGGDQVIAIEPAQNPDADAFMRIWN